MGVTTPTRQHAHRTIAASASLPCERRRRRAVDTNARHVGVRCHVPVSQQRRTAPTAGRHTRPGSLTTRFRKPSKHNHSILKPSKQKHWPYRQRDDCKGQRTTDKARPNIERSSLSTGTWYPGHLVFQPYCTGVFWWHGSVLLAALLIARTDSRAPFATTLMYIDFCTEWSPGGASARAARAGDRNHYRPASTSTARRPPLPSLRLSLF